MSMPPKKDHWIYGDGTFNVPPMPFRMGSSGHARLKIINPLKRPPTISELEAILSEPDSPPIEIGPDGEVVAGGRSAMTRDEFADRIRDAGRYAVKCATMDGREMDFDPDALIQNLVVGMLVLWNDDGLCKGDDWANPKDGGGENWKSPVKKQISTLSEPLPEPSPFKPDFEV